MTVPLTADTRVVVVLPTYRRPGPLVWSLVSVLRQAIPEAGSRRVVILNNDPDERTVERAVSSASREAPESGWSVEIVHRRPPMDPVLSWYGGIEELANAGDIVFLHGDDDIMLPGSVRERVEIMNRSRSAGAAMLLTHAAPGLVFESATAETAHLISWPSRPIASGAGSRRLTPRDLSDFGTAFIGNHCYRAGSVLSDAYRETLSLMRTLPIQGAQQLAMLPYFLPIPFADRGQLFGADVTGCIRGQSRQDIVGAKYGHTYWVPGLLYAACLRLLENEPLGSRADLDPLRRDLQRLRHVWHFPTLSSRTTRAQLRRLGLEGIDHGRYWRELISGIGMVLKLLTRTQGLRYRISMRGEGLRREQFFAALSAARR